MEKKKCGEVFLEFLDIPWKLPALWKAEKKKEREMKCDAWFEKWTSLQNYEVDKS